MAPILEANYPTDMALAEVSEVPMSRTHQYRKVMKPLLERKRRARINKCLDELKDLMVDALQSEGESISKLEKADVLELTVRHLQKLKRQKKLQANPGLDVDRFASGYSACANEVGQCLASFPGVDPSLGARLMAHLGHQLKSTAAPPCPPPPSAPAVPMMVTTASSPEPMDLKVLSDCGYSSGRESVSPHSHSLPSPPMVKAEQKQASREVWRPF